MGAHLGEDDQYFAVELGRGNRGFGFSIRGGREFHSMPLFVLRMAVDGKNCFWLNAYVFIFSIYSITIRIYPSNCLLHGSHTS